MRWLYRDLCINLYVIGMNLSEPHHGGINSKICLLTCFLDTYVIPYIAKNRLSANQH